MIRWLQFFSEGKGSNPCPFFSFNDFIIFLLLNYYFLRISSFLHSHSQSLNHNRAKNQSLTHTHLSSLKPITATASFIAALHQSLPIIISLGRPPLPPSSTASTPTSLPTPIVINRPRTTTTGNQFLSSSLPLGCRTKEKQTATTERPKGVAECRPPTRFKRTCFHYQEPFYKTNKDLYIGDIGNENQFFPIRYRRISKTLSGIFLRHPRMNRPQGTSALKRKRPESSPPAPSLTEHERILYDIIRSRQGMGIWARDMKREAKLSDNVVNRSINSLRNKNLRNKNLIKEVVNYQNKSKKTYMAAEFEPSKEITGGSWYVNGSLDQDYITMLKALCVKLISINKPGVVTLEGMTDLCNSTGVYKDELTRQQVEEILRALVLDKEISQVKSNGMGEFIGISTGKDSYKLIRKRGQGGALASIPCGVCPRISLCAPPDGVISPTNCVYYNKWLDF